MAGDFDRYLRWIKQHPAIWKFEKDDTPSYSSPEMLINLYAQVLDCLQLTPSYIHPNARIHASAIIDDNVIIEDGAQVLAHAIINGPTFIGRNAVVGNFSLLRGNCFISREALIGNHCYCNEAVIGRSARVAHFSNFSRSLLGYNSSISAFVLTATVKADKSLIYRARDGEAAHRKLGCVIGTNTFIAPHALLLPGIAVGHRCFIGSFAIVKHDVPNDTFIEATHSTTEKPNHIIIPKRLKVENFLDRSTSRIERRYAGVLLIDGARHLILQRRDARPGTYNPGRLSMLGGRIEGDETAAQCACRELSEESGLQVREDQLLYLAETVFTREDRSKTHCTIYLLDKSIDPAEIVLQEGRGIEILSIEEAAENPDLTELCRIAVAEYCRTHC